MSSGLKQGCLPALADPNPMVVDLRVMWYLTTSEARTPVLESACWLLARPSRHWWIFSNFGSERVVPGSSPPRFLSTPAGDRCGRQSEEFGLLECKTPEFLLQSPPPISLGLHRAQLRQVLLKVHYGVWNIYVLTKVPDSDLTPSYNW